MRCLKTTGLLTLLSIGLTACVPRPVFRLQSMSNNSTWYQGTEYIHSTADDITVTVAYVRHTKDNVIFDVEAVNNSGGVVRVDPVYFSYKATRADKLLAAGQAINPEAKLLDIDLEISDKKANQKSMLLLAAIGATAIIAEEIIDNDEEDEDNYRDESGEAAATYALAATTSSGIENSEYEVGSLKYKKERWATEALRISDLFPDDYIRGLVFFPIAEDADFYEIKIKAGNTIHTFRFRQFKFKP